MPTVLLIDLDDTLLDDRRAMAAAVLQLRERHRLVPNELDEAVASRWDATGRVLWARCAAGEITFDEQRRLRLRETFDLSAHEDQADAMFQEYLAFYEQHWALLPGARDFLASTAHLPRALVTNGRRQQVRRKLAMMALVAQFQAVVTPEDCGFRKPDPRMFLYALERIGAVPQDALMIGDNLASDIAPALALGMKAFHVCPVTEGRSIAHAARAAGCGK
jgi:putative hydrolase of the HAD superfamily